MLHNEVNKYLFDINTSIHLIDDYLGTKRDFEKYQSNKMLRRAVEKEFEIIGEAMSDKIKLIQISKSQVKS